MSIFYGLVILLCGLLAAVAGYLVTKDDLSVGIGKYDIFMYSLGTVIGFLIGTALGMIISLIIGFPLNLMFDLPFITDLIR